MQLRPEEAPSSASGAGESILGEVSRDPHLFNLRTKSTCTTSGFNVQISALVTEEPKLEPWVMPATLLRIIMTPLPYSHPRRQLLRIRPWAEMMPEPPVEGNGGWNVIVNRPGCPGGGGNITSKCWRRRYIHRGLYYILLMRRR